MPLLPPILLPLSPLFSPALGSLNVKIDDPGVLLAADLGAHKIESHTKRLVAHAESICTAVAALRCVHLVHDNHARTLAVEGRRSALTTHRAALEVAIEQRSREALK